MGPREDCPYGCVARSTPDGRFSPHGLRVHLARVHDIPGLRHLGTDRHQGEPLHVYVPLGTLRRLDRRARARGVTRSELVRELVAREVARAR